MLLRCSLVAFYLLVVHGEVVGTGQCPNVKTSLGSVRKRRHLTFPDGSAASITLSLTKAFMTHAPSGWFLVMDLDVIFPLPDANFTLAHSRRKLHHRQKKDVWQKIRNALDMHNMNGYACILKSICEARFRLAPKGHSLVHDILRAIFTAHTLEEEFEEEMGGTFNDVLDPDLCDRIHECPMSLLSLMLDINRPK